MTERDILHTVEVGAVIEVNGVKETVWYTETDEDLLRRNVILQSGKQLVSTPRSIDLFVPQTAPDEGAANRPIRTIELVERSSPEYGVRDIPQVERP